APPRSASRSIGCVALKGVGGNGGNGAAPIEAGARTTDPLDGNGARHLKRVTASSRVNRFRPVACRSRFYRSGSQNKGLPGTQTRPKTTHAIVIERLEVAPRARRKRRRVAVGNAGTQARGRRAPAGDTRAAVQHRS